MPQMLELENNSIFIGAEILEPIDEDSASQTHTIVIQYRVISNEKLQHYFKVFPHHITPLYSLFMLFKTHAEGMRTKFQGKTFDGKFTASRKVLKQLSFIKGMPQSNAFGYVF